MDDIRRAVDLGVLFNHVVDKVEFQLRVGVFNGIGDVVDEYDRIHEVFEGSEGTD